MRGKNRHQKKANKLTIINRIKQTLFISIILFLLLPISTSIYNNGFKKGINMLFNNKVSYLDEYYKAYNLIRYKLFNTTNNDTVIIGRDKILFSSQTMSGSDFDDYKGKNLFSDNEISNIKNSMDEISSYCKNNNINISFSIVPSKTRLYEKYLPSALRNEKGYSRYDQVCEIIDEECKINFIDLKKSLSSDIKNEKIYNKTENKISDLGVYRCYTTILNNLGIKNNINENELDITFENYNKGDLLNKIDLSDCISEKIKLINYNKINKYEVNKNNYYLNNDVKGNNTLIISDGSLKNIDILFSNSIHETYYNNSLEFDSSLIQDSKINNLVIMISEDNLGALINKLKIRNNQEFDKKDSESKEVTKLEQPSILANKLLSSDTVALAINCENADNVVITNNGNKTVLNKSNGMFIGQVKIIEGSNNTLQIYGCKDDLKSDSISIDVYGNINAEILPITINEDGYFFEKDYFNPVKITNDEINNIKNNVLSMKEHLESVNPNAKLVIAIAPNKSTMFYNYKNTSSSQLKKAFEDTDVCFVDIKEKLMKNKSIEDVFYKTDIHWNPLGAFIGYESIMEAIKPYSNTINILSEDDFDIRDNYIHTGELISYLGLGNNITTEKDKVLVPKKPYTSNYVQMPPLTWLGSSNKQLSLVSANSQAPTCIIYRDSFATCMLPYLAESFSNSYVQEEWQYNYVKSLTVQQKPDFVIYILAEKNVNQLANAILD